MRLSLTCSHLLDYCKDPLGTCAGAVIVSLPSSCGSETNPGEKEGGRERATGQGPSIASSNPVHLFFDAFLVC